MKFSLNWLKEYVSFDDTIEGLADRLTFAGLEVERIETIGGTFEGVVVGEVLAIEPHPNANKLRLCTVEYGGEETLRVVCGAPNVAIGGKYPFAPAGTILPSGKLKKAKIRGEVSMGMLCAADELGLGKEHTGLLVLDAKASPGIPFAELTNPPETIFELEITPNRPDCLSLIGIAREVAALYGTRLNKPSIELLGNGDSVNHFVRVDVQDTKKCPRYTARVLTNAKIGPSPDWIIARLAACDIRSINNVVDITNYVLLETGHPLHAFDYTLLKEGQIIVRHATPNEKITTLDGTERELTDEMLVIADSEKAIAIAGVMGGANTEIHADTSTILLESATFDTTGIRHTAKALGLHTESSYRFQRGINAASVEWASRRAAVLMVELAGATLCDGVIDVYPVAKTKRHIPVRWTNISSLMGLNLPIDSMKTILQTLEIDLLESDEQTAMLEIPTFRDDLEREVDMIEEIARMYGVDKIPEKLPTAEIVAGVDDTRVRAMNTCRKNLMGLGAHEILNYTLVNHSLLDLFGKNDRNMREELPHPISVEQSVLRTSLIPQMVESLGRNKSRQIDEAVFFEIGRTFIKTENGPKQIEKVCLGLMGAVGRSLLDKRREVPEEEIFLWLKGFVERLLAMQNVSKIRFQPLENATAFETGRAIKIFSRKTEIGVMGLIHRVARKKWRLHPVAAAELDLIPLISVEGKSSGVKDIPLYPAVERDFAFIVDESVRYEEILKTVRSTAPADLESIRLFDIFRGKSLGKGKKSLAFNVVYRSAKGTLTDEKIGEIHEKIGKRVCETVSAIIRTTVPQTLNN